MEILGSVSLITAFISLLIITICNIKNSFIIKEKNEAETEEVKVIGRREEFDKGERLLYVTFETIDGCHLDIVVPHQMYEVAAEPIIGRLTYNSTGFIRFVQTGINRIIDFYTKDYRAYTKKGLSRV